MIKKLNLRKILLHCKPLMTKNVLHSADISELYYVFFYNATVWSNWVGPSLQRFEKLSLRIRFKKSLTDFSNILVPIICSLVAQITNHFHSHFLFLETSLTQLEISSLNSDVWNLSLKLPCDQCHSVIFDIECQKCQNFLFLSTNKHLTTEMFSENIISTTF